MKMETEISLGKAYQSIELMCPRCGNQIKIPIPQGILDYREAYKELQNNHNERIELLGRQIDGLKRNLKNADHVMKAIDNQVRSGTLDSRSKIVDARLNYGEPFKYCF